MREEILHRTDKRPLAFIGTEIFKGNTKTPKTSRWHVVRVFETDDGYVVGIAKITCYPKERDRYSAIQRKTAQGVISLVFKLVPELTDQVREALIESSEAQKKETASQKAGSEEEAGQEAGSQEEEEAGLIRAHSGGRDSGGASRPVALPEAQAGHQRPEAQEAQRGITK